jgi:hypothetical protein
MENFLKFLKIGWKFFQNCMENYSKFFGKCFKTFQNSIGAFTFIYYSGHVVASIHVNYNGFIGAFVFIYCSS